MRNASLGICAECGKMRYRTRSDAKKAARRAHPGERMAAYPCTTDDNDGYEGRWHLGTMPTTIARGISTRDTAREYPPATTGWATRNQGKR